MFQMDAALRRLVDLLSHDHKEVSGTPSKHFLSLSVSFPSLFFFSWPSHLAPQVRELSALLVYKISLFDWQPVVHAGAFTKILTLSSLSYNSSRFLYHLASRSDEHCQVILSDGLALLMMNDAQLISPTPHEPIDLIMKASVAQLVVAFSALSSAMKTGQANALIFRFVLTLFQWLLGAVKPDLVLSQERTYTIETFRQQ
jgi:hypothetical protein